MGDDPDLTPEERFLAAIEHAAEVAGTWMADTWDAVRPFLRRLERLSADPEVQARLRWRAEEDRDVIRRACQCRCETAHPDARVCDLKAVTAVRDPDPGGPAEVPVCAPCAAEVIARQR